MMFNNYGPNIKDTLMMIVKMEKESYIYPMDSISKAILLMILLKDKESLLCSMETKFMESGIIIG